MTKAYAWYPTPTRQGLNVGHASLDISFGQGLGVADYVSWWPTEAVNLVTGAIKQTGQLRNFPGDCQEEGSQPGGAVEIWCLDESRMRARWAAIKARGNYSLFFKNCAFTVADVLCQGGADLSYDVRTYVTTIGMWTPWEIIRLARLINTYANTIQRQRNKGWEFETQIPSFIDLERSGH